MRLLSPRDSQILPTPVAGADDASADDGIDLKWELDEDSRHYYVPSWGDRGLCRIWG